MSGTLLVTSAAAMVLTAFVHSYFGEKRLIGPLLALDGGPMRILLVRQVLRGAWHLTSILMILNALAIVWPDTPPQLIMVTGGVWLVIGLADAVLTRGRHIGWPLLSGAGLLALLGALT